MAGGKSRGRRTTYRQSQLEAAAAEEEARKRASRRRWASILATVAAVSVVAVVLVTTGGDDGQPSDAALLEELRSTTTNLPNVGGRPCVPVADPLPDGAPAVAVREGPPPRELVTEDLRIGEGAVVEAEAAVTVHYVGVACSTGKIFDATYGGQPATFSLKTVIGGWQRGIPGMRVGGQRLLGMPPTLGYGRAGQEPDIARNESLWFVVEVLDTRPA